MIHGPCGYLNPSNSCMQKEGKCKLLLMNIRGPKSYEALRTVDGKCYTTFREAVEKKVYYILITT
ncbi:hypothetical protein H5410_041360 [Solanum commersonii]|uniref:Uncharacterized protein n=1 Tax=Solanum commersonii TaxID=4109 RepID=A0A9J5XV95_SOLCO|nr:hypothetical protein H5410_041360 [Solanum commersonii]